MNASTTKISEFLHDAGSSWINSEVRSAALFWVISLLGTSLLALIVCLLSVTPAWSGTLVN